MMRTLLAVLAVSMLSTASAEEAAYPNMMAELLKEGTKVGITRNADTGLVSVAIYSCDVYDILRDSATLTPDELDEKYPQLPAAKQKAADKYTASLETASGERPSGRRLGTPEAQVRLNSRVRLCTVVHVGKDYFVVVGEGETERRTAYAMRYVSNVGWINEIPISVYRRSIDAG